jgi:amylosucrase
MYVFDLHESISKLLLQHKIDIAGADTQFYNRFLANAGAIDALYKEIYGAHPEQESFFNLLLETILTAYQQRSFSLKQRDLAKQKKGNWFLSNELTGMSLYVDRFCGHLKSMPEKIEYFNRLGINLLHLMPVFQSPQGESDGGYAVSDFRNVDQRFGTMEDLISLQQKMSENNMFLMLDIVLNHTSHRHEWAENAKKGDQHYQDYYYMFPNRNIPDEFEKTLPEIFPEVAPGNFTWIEVCNKWVMTVFHNYQWDLNYTNPRVFIEMLDTIFFYANLGVDILRIDAPAFIWKQLGTTCQNLLGAHSILRLIKQCVQVATPGTALLGEAIVAPKEIMKYFGTGLFTAKECDFAYNATQMALQWDALATGDTRVMLAAQHDILQKPFGTSWITYTRCHDDIGLGYDDWMIVQAGYNAYEHRKYLKEYYSGMLPFSPAKGALFSVNPKTQDARISGSLASLCGLETAINNQDSFAINESIKKIMLMQAQSFFLGGLPMLFYGDEAGYTNDYSYLQDPGKSYDNRWMHRPVINWEKTKNIDQEGSIENRVFSYTQKLISIRKDLPVLADHKNLQWISPYNIHVAGYIRTGARPVFCLFNFKNKASYLTWYAFKEAGFNPTELYDHWTGQTFTVGYDNEYFILEPYSFYILEPK